MKLVQANSFKRVVKKMHPNQKRALDMAVKTIVKNPEAGSLKKGDLADLRVCKYKFSGQQYLLGYSYDAAEQVIALVAIGPHESFYRDIKR
ncbi:MAG: type II toxin-antitoxin system RelE/ParE family toxin [Mariprofundaceae bacterium]|nr:type II toxin-antitoxin system RelE/ParE family toxin [Mariprofundaceae bacterium]